MTEAVATRVYESWTDFLEAVKQGDVRFEDDAYARVKYDSPYSDGLMTIEGEVDYVTDNIGKAFSLEDRAVSGWHVEKGGRDLGRVETIEWEVSDE